MMCPRCNGDIRPWGVCQCDEKILKARIAELDAENQRLRVALDRYRGQIDRFGTESAGEALQEQEK